MEVEKYHGGGDGERDDISKREAATLAKKVLEKLYYPISNKLDEIEKDISLEFDKIRDGGGWMMHESYRSDATSDAEDVLLKNSSDPKMSGYTGNIKNLLEQYNNTRKELSNYLNLGFHSMLMSAIDDPSAGITVKDMEEVLNKKGVSGD